MKQIKNKGQKGKNNRNAWYEELFAHPNEEYLIR